MSCKFVQKKGAPADVFRKLNFKGSSKLTSGMLDKSGCTVEQLDPEPLCLEENRCDMYTVFGDKTCFYETDDYRRFLEDRNFVGDGDSHYLDCGEVVAAFSEGISADGDVIGLQKNRVNKRIDSSKNNTPIKRTANQLYSEWGYLDAMAFDLSVCEMGTGDYRCDKDVYVPQHREKGVFMCDEVHHKDGVDRSVGLPSRVLNVSQEQCYEACDAVREEGGTCPGVAYWKTGKRAAKMNTAQFYSDMQADAVRLRQTATCKEELPAFKGDPAVCLDTYVPNTKVRSVVVDSGGLVIEYGSMRYHKIHLERALKVGGMQGVCTLSKFDEVIDGKRSDDQQYKLDGCAMMVAKVFGKGGPGTGRGKVISERIVEDVVTSQKSRWRYIGEGFCRTKDGGSVVLSDKTSSSTFELVEAGTGYRVNDRLELTTEKVCSGSAGMCTPAVVQVTAVNTGNAITDFEVEKKGEGYLKDPTANPNGYDVAKILDNTSQGQLAVFKVRTMSMPTCQKSCGEDAQCMAMSYDEWTSFRLKNPTWNQKVQTKEDTAKCPPPTRPSDVCYAGYNKENDDGVSVNVCVPKKRWNLGLNAAQCGELRELGKNEIRPEVTTDAFAEATTCKMGGLQLTLPEEQCNELKEALDNAESPKPSPILKHDAIDGCVATWCPKVHVSKTATLDLTPTPQYGRCLNENPDDEHSCEAGGYVVGERVFVQSENEECAAINTRGTLDRGQTKQKICELEPGCVWDDDFVCEGLDDDGSKILGACRTAPVKFKVTAVGRNQEITGVKVGWVEEDADVTFANNMLRSGEAYPIRAEKCYDGDRLDRTKTTKQECDLAMYTWSGGYGSQLQPSENVNCSLYGGDQRYTQVDHAGNTFAAYDFTPYNSGRCMGTNETNKFVVKDPETGLDRTSNSDPLLCLQKCQLTKGCHAVNFHSDGTCLMLGKCVRSDDAAAGWKYSMMTTNKITLDSAGDLKVEGPGPGVGFPLVEMVDPRTCKIFGQSCVGSQDSATWRDFYERSVPRCQPLEEKGDEGEIQIRHQLSCCSEGEPGSLQCDNICGIGSEYDGPRLTDFANNKCRAAFDHYMKGQSLDGTGKIHKVAMCPLRPSLVKDDISAEELKALYDGAYEDGVTSESDCASRCRVDPTCAFFTYFSDRKQCQIYTREQCPKTALRDYEYFGHPKTRAKEFVNEATMNIGTSTDRACWSKEKESKYLDSMLITPEWRGDDHAGRSTCVLLGERSVWTNVQTKEGVKDANDRLMCSIPGKPCWAGYRLGCYARGDDGACPVKPIPPKHRNSVMKAIFGTDGEAGELEGRDEVQSRTQCTNVCSTDTSYACVDAFGAVDPDLKTSTKCKAAGHDWTNVSASCSYGVADLAPFALVSPLEGLPVESLMLSDQLGGMHHRGGSAHPYDDPCDDPLVASITKKCQKDFDYNKMGPMKHGFTLSDMSANLKVVGYNLGQTTDCSATTKEECDMRGGTCAWEQGDCVSTVNVPSKGTAKVLCSVRLDDHTFLFETESPKTNEGTNLPMPTKNVFDMVLQAKGERNVGDLPVGERCTTSVQCTSGRCDVTGSYGCYGRCICDSDCKDGEARTTKTGEQNCNLRASLKVSDDIAAGVGKATGCEDRLRFLAARIRPRRYAEGFTRYKRQRPKKQPTGDLCAEDAHCASGMCGNDTSACNGSDGRGKRCVDSNGDCAYALGSPCDPTTKDQCAAGLMCGQRGECYGRCTDENGKCPSNLRPLTSADMNEEVGLDENGCGPFTMTVDDAVRICGDSAPRDTAACNAKEDKETCTAPCVWHNSFCRADARIKKCNAFLRFENRHMPGNNKTCYYTHTGPQLATQNSLEPWEVREPGQKGAGASGDTFVQQITQPFIANDNVFGNTQDAAGDAFGASVRPYEWEPLLRCGSGLNCPDGYVCRNSTCELPDAGDHTCSVPETHAYSALTQSATPVEELSLSSLRSNFQTELDTKYRKQNHTNVHVASPAMTTRTVPPDEWLGQCDAYDPTKCCPNDTQYVRAGGNPSGSVCTFVDDAMRRCRISEQHVPSDPKERWKMLCDLTRGYRSQGTFTVADGGGYNYRTGDEVSVTHGGKSTTFRVTKIDEYVDISALADSSDVQQPTRGKVRSIVHETGKKHVSLDTEKVFFDTRTMGERGEWREAEGEAECQLTTTLVADLTTAGGIVLQEIFANANIPQLTSYKSQDAKVDSSPELHGKGGVVVDGTGKYLVMHFSEGFEALPTNGAGSQMNLLNGCLAKLLVECEKPEVPKGKKSGDKEEVLVREEGSSPLVGLVLALVLVGLIYARTKGKVNTSLLFGYAVLGAGGSFLYYSG